MRSGIPAQFRLVRKKKILNFCAGTKRFTTRVQDKSSLTDAQTTRIIKCTLTMIAQHRSECSEVPLYGTTWAHLLCKSNLASFPCHEIRMRQCMSKDTASCREAQTWNRISSYSRSQNHIFVAMQLGKNRRGNHRVNESWVHFCHMRAAPKMNRRADNLVKFCVASASCLCRNSNRKWHLFVLFYVHSKNTSLRVLHARLSIGVFHTAFVDLQSIYSVFQNNATSSCNTWPILLFTHLLYSIIRTIVALYSQVYLSLLLNFKWLKWIRKFWLSYRQLPSVKEFQMK